MGNALVCGVVREIGKELFRLIYGEEPVSSHPIEEERNPKPMLNLDLFNEFKEDLVRNQRKKDHQLDPSKNLLISGNMFNLSNSIGTSLLYLPDGVLITCLNLDGAFPPSPVIIVLEGESIESGNVIEPSEKVYS